MKMGNIGIGECLALDEGGENDVVDTRQDHAADTKNPDELVSDRPG
jgi:hypothetical protein